MRPGRWSPIQTRCIRPRCSLLPECIDQSRRTGVVHGRNREQVRNLDVQVKEGLSVSLVELSHASNDVNVEGDSVAVMDLHRRDISDEQLHQFEQYAAE